MMSRPRLAELPFLAATLAMALALALPWILASPAADPPVQLAGEVAAPASAAQP